MSAKEAISDKLQGSVAVCALCGEVVNNQIKKSLLLSLWLKKIEIGEYLAKLQRSCLMQFARLANTPLEHFVSQSSLSQRQRCHNNSL